MLIKSLSTAKLFLQPNQVYRKFSSSGNLNLVHFEKDLMKCIDNKR